MGKVCQVKNANCQTCLLIRDKGSIILASKKNKLKKQNQLFTNSMLMNFINSL